MEIYTLTILFPYDEDEPPWSRIIEVEEDFTLIRLHKYIQKVVGFDDDHMYEFYIGKNPRNRASSVPKRTKLNEIYPLKCYKLYYLFDFGASWLFEIRKSRKKKIENKKCKYPLVIESTGINPVQYQEHED